MLTAITYKLWNKDFVAPDKGAMLSASIMLISIVCSVLIDICLAKIALMVAF
jgi:hypothetical protein